MKIEGKGDNFNVELDAVARNITAYYPEVSLLDGSFSESLENIKGKIIKIRHSGETTEVSQMIECNPYKSDTLFVRISNDHIESRKNVTKGEVISGMEWDKEFSLYKNEFMKHKSSQELYDKLVLSRAEKEIRDLLDIYILDREIKKNDQEDKMKMEAYIQIKNRNSAKSLDRMPLGVMAEKMVFSFLARVAADNPGLDFEVEHANVYQDVEQKIDFIVKTKNMINNRGVRVEADEKITKIQFTINASKEGIDLKNKQMARFNDVVLIQMPELHVREAIKKWQASDEKVAGPDKYLDRESQKTILEKILKGLVTDEILEKAIKNARI